MGKIKGWVKFTELGWETTRRARNDPALVAKQVEVATDGKGKLLGVEIRNIETNQRKVLPAKTIQQAKRLAMSYMRRTR